MYKKLFLVLMVLALVASGTALFAGGTKETATTSSGTQSTSSGKMAVETGASLVFSGWGDESEQKIYKDSITRFNAVYPDVKVDFQPIPSDFQTKIKAMAVAGNAPDVFYVDDQLMTALGMTGQLMALDDVMKTAGVSRADFIPALLTVFTYNGKTYALPKDWGTLGLVYLPAAFQAAGIAEPTDNWTWDDLEKAALTIKQKTKYAGFVQNADWARFAPWAFALGGSYTDASVTKGTLSSDAVKQAASFILKMKTEGSLVTASDVGASWAGEAIGKQLAAMTYEGGWMVNFMRQSYPDVQWKVVQLAKASNGTRANVIFTNGLGVNAKTKYPKAAAALALFITGRENQGAIQATGFAYSAHPEQLAQITNPQDKAISAGGLVGKVAFWGPNTGKINDAVSKALENIYLGSQTVDQALAAGDAVINDVLAGK